MSSNIVKQSRQERRKLRIVEIVGPAGAGKTTLYQGLSSYRGIHLSNFPDVRKVVNAPFFILSGFQILPVSLWMFRFANEKITRREFAWFSIVSGWPRVLRSELKRNEDIILLDQGPVYLLSEMSLLAPALLKNDRTRQICQTWYSQWAALVDAIVWLDAPDECLINRIRSREKEHVVKDASPEEVIKFLGIYRNVYERTLSELKNRRGDIKILRFDTNLRTSKEITKELLVDFALDAA